jgi:hypothetical protein
MSTSTFSRHTRPLRTPSIPDSNFCSFIFNMSRLAYFSRAPSYPSNISSEGKWPEVPYSPSTADRQAVRPQRPSRYAFLFRSKKGMEVFYSLASTGKALRSLRSLLFEDKWGGKCRVASSSFGNRMCLTYGLFALGKYRRRWFRSACVICAWAGISG